MACRGARHRGRLAPGRGRSAIPIHSAIVGFSLAVMLLVATLGFGGSLQKLLDTPHLYGGHGT